MRTSEMVSKHQIIHWQEGTVPKDTTRYKAAKIIAIGQDTWYKQDDIGRIFMVDMKSARTYENGAKVCVRIVTEKYQVLDSGFDTRHIEFVPILSSHFEEDLFTL